jgi:peptide/nickel transport system substrate-binding protein
MQGKKLQIMLIVVAVLLALVVAPVAAQDSEVVVAVAIEPVSMDAWRGFAETGGPGFLNVVEQLVTRNFETGELVPVLASSWEQIDDSTLQFTLREGVTFHDGSPLNAEAAVVSINYMFDEDNAFDILDFVGAALTAEVVDEYSFTVSSPEPDPTLANKMYFVTLSSAQQILDAPDTYATELIGTGPYRFVEWRRGESLIYEANPDWWGLSDPDAAGGAVSFDRAVYRFLEEDQVRSAAVQAGEVDIAQFITPEQCAESDANPDTRCLNLPSVETIFIRMDTNSPMFSDIRVRQAFQMAIDKALIIETLLGGAATLTGQIVNETALGHNPNLEPYAYDPDEAAALLEAAAADGVPVDLEVTLGARVGVFAGVEEVIQAVANMLSEVGFNVTTEFLDAEGFGEVMLVNIKDVPESRNFVAIHVHGNEILDLAVSYNFYYSCDGILSTYCNEEAEALWLEAQGLAGDDRDALLQQVNQIIHDDVAVGYIGHLNLAYAVSNAVNWEAGLDHRLQAKEMSPS